MSWTVILNWDHLTWKHANIILSGQSNLLISGSLILPRVNEGLSGKDLQRTGLDSRMLAEVPDALTHNLR